MIPKYLRIYLSQPSIFKSNEANEQLFNSAVEELKIHGGHKVINNFGEIDLREIEKKLNYTDLFIILPNSKEWSIGLAEIGLAKKNEKVDSIVDWEHRDDILNNIFFLENRGIDMDPLTALRLGFNDF